MRLTSPAIINFGNMIFTEKGDLVNVDVDSEKNNFFPRNQLLQLPQAFGNIYLGETFSSYITTHPVHSVSVKCDLQSNNSRISIPIHANKTIPTSLNHGETLDDVIHYEVKEIGTHIQNMIFWCARWIMFLQPVFLWASVSSSSFKSWSHWMWLRSSTTQKLMKSS